MNEPRTLEPDDIDQHGHRYQCQHGCTQPHPPIDPMRSINRWLGSIGFDVVPEGEQTKKVLF